MIAVNMNLKSHRWMRFRVILTVCIPFFIGTSASAQDTSLESADSKYRRCVGALAYAEDHIKRYHPDLGADTASAMTGNIKMQHVLAGQDAPDVPPSWPENGLESCRPLGMESDVKTLLESLVEGNRLDDPAHTFLQCGSFLALWSVQLAQEGQEQAPGNVGMYLGQVGYFLSRLYPSFQLEDGNGGMIIDTLWDQKSLEATADALGDNPTELNRRLAECRKIDEESFAK